MSDETTPPEEGTEDANESESPSASAPIHFFDDGLEEPSDFVDNAPEEANECAEDPLEQPPSMHAAVGRATLSIATKGPSDESTTEEPASFPLPIELSLFQGSAPSENHETELDEADEALEATEGNVISLLPRVAATGAVWDLNPAGEETIRDAFEEGGELTPPDPHMLEGTIEALLFSTHQPLTLKQIHTHLASPGIAVVREALHRIQSRFRRPGSGIRLVEVAKGWQFRTDMRAARYVSEMRGVQPVKLSKAALETLSIVAYRQPVTRAEVEDLRGVDPGGILRMLSERGLICVTGRKDEPGRPLLYGTTPEFLALFGLRDLSDLPTLRDLRELQQDDQRDNIGSTDVASPLSDALRDVETPSAVTPMVSVQEPLPLDGLDPID